MFVNDLARYSCVLGTFLIQKLVIPSIPGAVQLLVLLMAAVVSVMLISDHSWLIKFSCLSYLYWVQVAWSLWVFAVFPYFAAELLICFLLWVVRWHQFSFYLVLCRTFCIFFECLALPKVTPFCECPGSLFFCLHLCLRISLTAGMSSHFLMFRFLLTCCTLLSLAVESFSISHRSDRSTRSFLILFSILSFHVGCFPVRFCFLGLSLSVSAITEAVAYVSWFIPVSSIGCVMIPLILLTGLFCWLVFFDPGIGGISLRSLSLIVSHFVWCLALCLAFFHFQVLVELPLGIQVVLHHLELFVRMGLGLLLWRQRC